MGRILQVVKLEKAVDIQIFSYPNLYWDVDRPHARIKVLNEMFLSTSSSFSWDSDGTLYNQDLKGVVCKEHIDHAWLEENRGTLKQEKFRPSPVSEKSNIALVPDNVQPDFLEAAYEIAKYAMDIFTTEKMDDYFFAVPKETIKENVKLVLKGKDENFDVPYHYHRMKEQGTLTIEAAEKHEAEILKSKVRRMVYVLEDFMEQYDKIKKLQEKITVYLDDNRPTPNDFDVHVYNTEQAINMLKYENITLISLDNDLGSYSEEGYKVAEFIEQEAFHGNLKPLSVHVHSANTVRNKFMVKAVEQANKYWNKK